MKTTFQKVLSAMLAVMLLITALSGGGASADAVQEAAIERMCQDCFQMLQLREQVNYIHYWILDYADAYIQDRSWDSLLKARAVASAGYIALKQMELPVMSLTEEDCILLMDAGIEADALLMEYENMETWCSQTLDTLLLWYYTLEDDTLLRTAVEEEIPLKSELDRSSLALECHYYCNLANYLLLQMELPQELWNQWLEQLPCLGASGAEWYETIKEVESQTSSILDELAPLEIQMGAVTGSSQYTAEVIQEAVETEDLTTLSREMFIPSGVPGFFLLPSWTPDVVNLYLVTDPDTGKRRLPHAGEELPGVPSSCYVHCGAVAWENIEDYQEQLEVLDYAACGDWETPEERYQLLVVSGESSMLIEWTPEETGIYLAEPMGCLIPALYFKAMQQSF